MVDLFRRYINDLDLFDPDEEILLAVSGGIDSMVMAWLFHYSSFRFAIAHCNFNLRGEESEGDEEFVRLFCRDHGITFHVARFETVKYAAERKISVQMAARELRYEWFEKIRSENGYSRISLAHNMNDRVETFLLNLGRGTGLRGLTGIKAKADLLIRPMMFASRETISLFAIEKGISYREDSSNIETKYSRNKIRHKVIPLLEELNPSFLASVNDTIGRLDESYVIFSRQIELLRNSIFSEKGEFTHADSGRLTELKPLDTCLYELFRPYGVGTMQVDELKKLLFSKPGKSLVTSTHRILKDRNEIIIGMNEGEKSEDELIIASPSELERLLPDFRCEVLPAMGLIFSKDPSHAYFDADRIEFPLTVRKWREGDYFYPLGMQGRKKISDLLIDIKVPRSIKERVRIISSSGDICWVIGYRSDNRFRVTGETEAVLTIRWTGEY